MTNEPMKGDTEGTREVRFLHQQSYIVSFTAPHEAYLKEAAFGIEALANPFLRVVATPVDNGTQPPAASDEVPSDSQKWIKCADCRTSWDINRHGTKNCPVCGVFTACPHGKVTFCAQCMRDIRERTKNLPPLDLTALRRIKGESQDGIQLDITDEELDAAEIATSHLLRIGLVQLLALEQKKLAQAESERDRLIQTVGNLAGKLSKCSYDWLAAESELATLREAVGERDRLVHMVDQPARALIEAMETCHICKDLLVLQEDAVHCEDCSYDCEGHEEPECVPIYVLHARLKAILAALPPVSEPAGSEEKKS